MNGPPRYESVAQQQTHSPEGQEFEPQARVSGALSRVFVQDALFLPPLSVRVTAVDQHTSVALAKALAGSDSEPISRQCQVDAGISALRT